MSNLIRADLGRILKKVNVWVLFLVSAFFCALSVYAGRASHTKWNGFVFLTSGIPSLMVYLLISLAVLLGVFGDDRKAGSLSTVIGRGFSRTEVVFAKFLDSVILLFGMLLILACMNFVLSLVLGAPMTAIETKSYILQHFVNACTMLGYMTIAVMFLYLTNSMPLTIIIEIVLILLASTLRVLLNSFYFVRRYNLTHYDLDGFLKNAYSDFMLGMPVRGFISLAMGLLIFVGGALAISQLIFHLKELDF